MPDSNSVQKPGTCGSAGLSWSRFSTRDLAEYQAWFSDPDLARELGPVPDEDWLSFVMQDETGRQYAVRLGPELIAVVGCQFPANEDRRFVVTDLAVHPRRRGEGWGRRVIAQLLQRHPAGKEESWNAFVDQRNEVAVRFFERLGWVRANPPSDGDGMWVWVAPETHWSPERPV